MTAALGDGVFDSDALDAPDGTAWDLLVIGGGTAGIVAAKTAAGLGASVLLVEPARTGGDCLWTGCVPSKALLAAAHAAAAARRAGTLGVHVDGVRVDFGEVSAHVQQAIATIEPVDSPAALRAAGIRVAQGTVRLTGPAAADVDGMSVPFRQALLATGSAPVVPAVPGLGEVAPLTSDTVWGLRELPGRLLVLGAGSVGCELGQAFARLGSQVTIVESAPRVLPGEDPAASAAVRAALVEDGVRVLAGVELRTVTPMAPGGEAICSDGSSERFDMVLVATGRRPRTAELGLSAAGVELDERGYAQVDDRLRTANPRIWAAGDVTGHPQFTHVAGVHGSLAASNAVLGLRRSIDATAVPRVTFTQPEVAAVGMQAHDVPPGSRMSVRTVAHQDVDRAIAESDTRGLTRLILDRNGRVVGALVVGPRAGESLAELVLAAQQGMRARDLAGTMHAYPTYGDGAWKAAIAEVQDNLRRPVVHAAIRALSVVRRRRSR